MPDWTIYARKSDGGRGGILTRFSKVDVIPRLELGTWVIDDVPPADARALGLLDPRAGVVFTRDDNTVLSGPITSRTRKFDQNGDSITIAGCDDKVYLQNRLAHPEPGSAAPSGSPPVFGSTAYDSITGPASTVIRHYVDVNAGPSAVAYRRVSGLTLAADPVIGATLHFSARWLNLLDVVQAAARLGDIAFDIIDLELSIYQPEDRTGTIVFSTELGNLAGFTYSQEAPKTNFETVGGGGEGIARVIVQAANWPSVIEWGLVEEFRDRRDTSDVTELRETATKELLDKSSRTGLSITPIDTAQMAYGVHYNLGDKVTAIIDDERIEDRIREVHFTLDKDGEQVVPGIGDSDVLAGQKVPRLFSNLRDINGRMTALETI